MKKILTLLLSLASLTTTAETLTSPSGNVALDFRLINNGVPCYSMNYNGEEVIKPSMLGIAMKDHTELWDCFEIEKTETSTFDETWTPVWGEETSIRNHYNELYVLLRQTTSNRRMALRFRVFDDGVGFRYEWPEQRELAYFVIK